MKLFYDQMVVDKIAVNELRARDLTLERCASAPLSTAHPRGQRQNTRETRVSRV
jgi:hypothetical protein